MTGCLLKQAVPSGCQMFWNWVVGWLHSMVNMVKNAELHSLK